MKEETDSSHCEGATCLRACTGNSTDQANAIAADDKNNLYITGYTTNTQGNEDYTTVSYSPAGQLLWLQNYDGPAQQQDYATATAIAIDGNNNAYVTGASVYNACTELDYLTIKYSQDGTLDWVQRYNGASNGEDIATTVIVDNEGNVYVGGESWKASYDMVVVKYWQNLPQQSVTYLIRPDYSRGYVAWKNTDDNVKVDSWKVEIMQKNSSGEYDKIKQFEQKQNYVRLDAQYRQDNKMYVKVSALDVHSNILSYSKFLSVFPHDEIDPAICGNCTSYGITARWKCNGLDYAYEIQKVENSINGTYYLSLQSTEDYVDTTTQTGIPFYWYYDETIFKFPKNIPAHLINNGHPTFFYSSSNKYVTQTGNLITGPTVGGIPKKLEQFEGAESRTPNPFISDPSFNSKNISLNDAIATFNNYTEAINRPELECTPYPPLPVDPKKGWIKHTPWWDSIPKTLHDSIIWHSDGTIEWGKTGKGHVQYSDDFFSTLANNDYRYNSDFNPIDTAYPVSKYEEFVIERIDAEMETITLLPENIYLENGIINRPKINLQKGLYRMSIWFAEERSYLPLVFEEK